MSVKSLSLRESVASVAGLLGSATVPGGTEIAVAGDLLGHLIGTLSHTDGTIPVAGAAVTVTGRTPVGPWTQTVTTDGNGLFQANLPLGSTGPITVTGGTVTGTFDSADIAVGLTPRSPAPESRLSLEGDWQIAVDPISDGKLANPAEPPRPAAWSPIAVPSHWVMEGFVSETGLASYRRSVTIPVAWRGKRIKFRSEGIHSIANVWINSTRVGSHEGGTTPFELDITEAAKPGAENTLDILVNDTSDAGNLDNFNYFAHVNLGGIWRPLELFCVEPAHVARLALSTHFDDQYQDAELVVDVTLANEQATELRAAALRLECLDPQGKAVPLDGLAARVSLGPWERKRVTLRAKVAQPEHWNAERPRLYTLRTTLTTSQGRADIEQRFGFREIEIKGQVYLFNGKPIKMWGAGRMDSRLSLGVSGYRKITDDALLSVRVAPSVTGEGVSQVINVGKIRNTGLELTSTVQVVRGGPVTWSATANLRRNRNLLVSLAPGLTAFYTSSGIRMAPGYPVASRWTLPILGYADGNGDGILQPSEVQLGDTAVYAGATEPSFNAGLATTVSLWRAVSVNVSFSYQDGLTQRNETAYRLATFSRGYQDPAAPLVEQLLGVNSTFLNPSDYSTNRSNVGFGPAADYSWVQTVNTWRLESLAVTYNVPNVVARRLGAQNLSVSVQGANLGLWTNYRGLDPNVNAFGTGNNVTDTGILPQPRTWQVHVRATY